MKSSYLLTKRPVYAAKMNPQMYYHIISFCLFWVLSVSWIHIYPNEEKYHSKKSNKQEDVVQVEGQNNKKRCIFKKFCNKDKNPTNLLIKNETI